MAFLQPVRVDSPALEGSQPPALPLPKHPPSYSFQSSSILCQL